MHPTPADFFTRAQPSGRAARLLRFPLLRIPVALLFLAPGVGLLTLLVHFGVDRLPEPGATVLATPLQLAAIPLLLWLYSLYVRRIERRRPLEIGRAGWLRETAAGAGLAALLLLPLVGLLALLGFYQVSGAASPWMLIVAFATFATGAFGQELIFRVIVYRLVEEWVGTVAAMVAVALLFTLAHIANANMDAISFAAMVVGDLLLLAAFALTRRLWFVWGIHLGWNFLQDGVLGLPNSGITALPSWLEATLDGPRWLSGGAFGLEASLVILLLQLIVAGPLLALVIKRGQFVPARARRGAVPEV